MPPVVAAAVITAGAVTGTSIASGKMQSGAAKTAAQLQTDAANKALAYTKQKDAQERADAMAAQKASYESWAAKERRMAPYRATGQGASQTIGHLLGVPAVDIPEPAPPPAYLSAPPQGDTGTMGPLVPRGNSGFVNMRAPTGQMKAIPESQVDYFLSRGATLVNH